MLVLPVTLTIAAACAVVNLWLAVRIVPGRMRGKVMLGDGGDERLFALQRAHANFIEYAPFALILIAAIELAGGSPSWLWGLGGGFVAVRIAHGLGMTRPAPNPLRAVGALGTWVLLAALAGWALVIAYTDGARPAPVRLAPATDAPSA